MIKVDSSAPLTKEWHVEDWKAKVGKGFGKALPDMDSLDASDLQQRRI